MVIFHPVRLVGVELADTSYDEGYHGDSAEPPCRGYARGETGDYKQDGAYDVEND